METLTSGQSHLRVRHQSASRNRSVATSAAVGGNHQTFTPSRNVYGERLRMDPLRVSGVGLGQPGDAVSIGPTLEPDFQDSGMIYSTQNLNVAVALHATNALSFQGCVRISPVQVEFQFNDPKRAGDDLALAFDTSELAAPINTTLASLRYLRRKMTEALRD